MAAKITYSVTLPDGNKVTRKSARRYTHACVILNTSWDATEPSWGVASFNGDEDLAQKEAKKWWNWKAKNPNYADAQDLRDVKVVEVEIVG